ncbi:hypothetical protein Tco_0221490 [Tanacetum coccineum]
MSTSWTTHPQTPPTKTTSNPDPKQTNTPTNKAIEGQQDGLQDDKGEGEAEEKRKQTSHKKVVNFFITNLLGFNILGNQFSYEYAADWI